MSGPRESARLWAAPKGNAKALRQKNRAMTMLRKAQLSARRRCNLTAQPPGNLSGIRTEAQGIQRGTLCHFFLSGTSSYTATKIRRIIMSELKRTQLYDVHVQAGASMVDFGGWEMPIQYPSGIVSEHLYTRHACSLFDVSHMGRLLVEGPDRLAFLQHVLSSNVAGLDLNTAQYCIIPASNGGAVRRRIPVPLRRGAVSAGGQRRQHRQGPGPSGGRPVEIRLYHHQHHRPIQLPSRFRVPRARRRCRFSPAAWPSPSR